MSGHVRNVAALILILVGLLITLVVYLLEKYLISRIEDHLNYGTEWPREIALTPVAPQPSPAGRRIALTPASPQPRPQVLAGKDELVLEKYIQENSKNDEGGGCVICLEEYKDGDTRAVITACNHRFHAVCIKTWLVENDTCPLCRAHVV
ncbi:E3 ubiquitin-protein ligase DZIP3 [Sesamum alatum]|uniref:E3 ubiquitin-protein ligase DZIP3 n=1 Tax=Sesamum alatum TaxID=300844 RepID=A0AAE1Z2L1_9LAMI|nr:E3 ubiquitin-protein ligase DZIP3 [Sesamum alatum]